MTIQDTFEKIATADNETHARWGVDSRQFGDVYIYMVLDMARAILVRVDVDDITPELLELLTEENFHTARHACEVLLSLDRYSMRGYMEGTR